MVSFYKNLKQGKNKAQALQQAKLTYLNNAKNEKLKHPFYWAGFILSGDDSPIHFPGPFWKQPIFGISLFSILAIVLIRSEEHKSELQSLMRNSYAVFCLHKTKQN